MITIWVPKRLVEIDLYNVAACSPQQLAQLSEHSYAQRVNYAAQKMPPVRRKDRHAHRPVGQRQDHQRPLSRQRSAAAGHPGAGRQSGQFLQGARVLPRLPDGTLDYENPDTLDLPLIKQCLRELSETGKTTCPSTISRPRSAAE